MPTYEYVCKECGEHLETVQAFSDPSLTTCAACGGPLRKVFGNVGIVFKGSGFYKTDSRTATNGSKAASSDGGTDKSGTDQSGTDQSGSDKAGSDKAGSDKAGSDTAAGGTKDAASGTSAPPGGSSSTTPAAASTTN